MVTGDVQASAANPVRGQAEPASRSRDGAETWLRSGRNTLPHAAKQGDGLDAHDDAFLHAGDLLLHLHDPADRFQCRLPDDNAGFNEQKHQAFAQHQGCLYVRTGSWCHRG